jgi:signal transduction histidine kinase
VNAKNGDGLQSREDAIVQVVVLPPFYRTWWFTTMMATAVLCLLWGVWQWRVRQLSEAQIQQQRFSRELIASQETERGRIAAELHDSLGQRLIIINNLALFLLRTKGKVRSEADKQQTMEEISQEAPAAIEETRAISYALRPFQLDRLGLSKAVQALARTVASASEIELMTDLTDIDDAFPEDLRINFFRIVQEALNNIVKHSKASRGTVKAERTASSVVLTISDNGQGFPNEPRNHVAGPGGFGLTGIRERATLLKGTLHITSSAETGTLLTVEFPTRGE